MNLVIRHIEYLISRSDCVIVPGLGAILARRQSAYFDVDQMTVSAPRRVFAFNPSLQQSDATLACSIAREKGISYDAANDLMVQEVETMNRQLRLTGELPLGRIGNLAFNAETAVPEFIPYEADSLSCETAWLSNLDLNQATVEEPSVEEPQFEFKPISPFGRFVRIAASIALLICICFIASTPISINDAALASLSPQLKPVAVEDLMPADARDADLLATIEAEAQNENGLVALPEIESITVYSSHPNGIEMQDEDSHTSLTAPTKKYCIVVGSFTTLTEAEKFVNNKDIPGLTIFEAQGRYRVYSSAYDDESAAYRDLSLYPGAWVCSLSQK